MALVETEQTDTVLTLRLNRPDKLNSITIPLATLLLQELTAAASNPAVRVVVITGNGRGFCAGQDLTEVTTPLPASDGQLPDLSEIVARYNSIVTMITGMGKPVVAAVNGVAAGAGANIALACDFVVAIESASFMQSFVQIGLIPDSGGTFFLPRLVGLAKAKELTMLGEKLSAREAQQLGLVYRAVAEAEYLPTLNALTKRLASLPTRSLGLIKQAFNRSAAATLEAQLESERVLQLEAAGTADYREGVEAFLTKRAPHYTGR